MSYRLKYLYGHNGDLVWDEYGKVKYICGCDPYYDKDTWGTILITRRRLGRIAEFYRDLLRALLYYMKIPIMKERNDDLLMAAGFTMLIGSEQTNIKDMFRVTLTLHPNMKIFGSPKWSITLYGERKEVPGPGVIYFATSYEKAIDGFLLSEVEDWKIENQTPKTIKKYKLIKEYPGSPAIGTVVEQGEPLFYGISGTGYVTSRPANAPPYWLPGFYGGDQVEKFPEFWEQVIPAKEIVITVSGVDKIYEGAIDGIRDTAKYWFARQVQSVLIRDKE